NRLETCHEIDGIPIGQAVVENYHIRAKAPQQPFAFFAIAARHCLVAFSLEKILDRRTDGLFVFYNQHSVFCHDSLDSLGLLLASPLLFLRLRGPVNPVLRAWL